MRQVKLCEKTYERIGLLSIGIGLGLLLLNAQFAYAQKEKTFQIRWHDHIFHTNKPLPRLPDKLMFTAYPPELKAGYYFVQFKDKVTKAMKKAIMDSGGELMNYVPNNTYIVRMSAAVRAKVETLSDVQYVGIYQPAMRLSQGLLKRIQEKKPKVRPKSRIRIEIKPKEAPEIEELRLTVLVFRGEDLKRIKQAVELAGGKVLSVNKGTRRSKLFVKISYKNALKLPLIYGVMWIEEFDFFESYNDIARNILDVDPVWTSANNLRGNGQILAVADTGLDSGQNNATMHNDFQGRITAIFSWPVQNHYGTLNPGADDGANDLDSGHGTHVAGSVLGDGNLSGGTYNGVAPAANLVFQAIEQFSDILWTNNDYYANVGIPADLNDLFQEAYDAGARIHTNSWGRPVAGEYTADAEEVDEFVWNHPDMFILFSAGNSGEDDDQDNVVNVGSLGSPGSAKNCLTVGATENNRPAIPKTWHHSYGPVINADQKADNPNGMAAFSSRGPANFDTVAVADDRIKPDVVAPGTYVISTRSRSAPNTIWYDDDVEGGIAGWGAAGNWAQTNIDSHSANTSWHDSPAGNYADNTDISLTSPTINLLGGGQGGKAIQFWCRYDLGEGDEWRIEVSDDNGANFPGWIEYLGTQANWELITVGMRGTDYNQSANFRMRFRLISDNDGDTGDGLFIDDVRIVEGSFGSSLLSDQGMEPVGSVVDQSYMFLGGTSMATPLVAGCAALARQYYTDVEGLRYVSAALLRATLINGAVDLNPGQYGAGPNLEIDVRPNNVEGWGRVNINNSLFPNLPAVLDFKDELAGLETNESHAYSLNIVDNSIPAVITMVYHDAPGAGLINNLDMTITTPGGAILNPNGLTTDDEANNVEQIVIPVPVVGTYTITIDGDNVPQGPQPYALVTTAGGNLVDRDPVDVMLVLDLSGSMLSLACPTCNQKLQVLKDAVELFIQLWTAVTVPDDLIGVTYFKTNISEFSSNNNILVPVLPNADQIISDVHGQTTVSTNLTAMGGGLQSAINNLTDATRPQNIILFTDGMQNVNPMVQTIDDSPPLGAFHLEINNEPGRTNSDINPTDPPTRLDTNLGIKINTIGVGATSSFVDLLDNIASDTGGISKLTTAPDDDLRRFYVEELINVLKEFSPQLISYRYGRTNISSTTTETFTINKSAYRVILKLSWKRGDKLTFRVEKDGLDITRFGKIINDSYYQIFFIDLPVEIQGQTLNSGGNWKMLIEGTEGANYEAAAIADEVLFEYDFDIGRKDYVVGEPLELNVRLTIGKRPVTDAERVTTTILNPTQGLGTLLSIYSMPSVPPGYPLESQLTIGQRKFQLLLQNERFYQDLRGIKQTINLQNTGNGNYSANFTDTDIEGIYTVIFRVEGESTIAGKYNRTETLSTLVRFGKAELEASKLFARLEEATQDGRRMILTVRPKDRFGNYLGPDYGHRIKATLSAGSVSSDKEDHGDGSYSILLFIPSSTDPILTVSVMDQPLYEGPLSERERKPHFGLSIHSGIAIPVGSFKNNFNSGLNMILDLTYRLTPDLSLVGLFGYNAFNSKTTGVDDTYWLNLSANLKYCLRQGTLYPFLNGGMGFYIPKSGNSNLGANLGAGINYEYNNFLTFEMGIDYHSIFRENIQFLHAHAGVIFRF